MREADRLTIEEVGIPSLVLMENAGRQIVEAIEVSYESALNGSVAIFCGCGNNGGDGFVVARTLNQRGIDTRVFVIGVIAKITGDAKINLDALGHVGISVVEIADEQTWELHLSEIAQCSIIVDGLFGTGLHTGLDGMLATIVGDINGSDVPVVSIDLPSGLSADTAEVLGSSITASMTVTLAAPKVSLVLPAAEDHAGDVVIADIGIPDEIISGLDGPRIELLTSNDFRKVVEPRVADSHKGDYGRITLVAGSRGKTGAAHLAAMGALRSGSGLVTVATPASCQPIVAAMAPEYLTEALVELPDGDLTPAAVDAVLAGRHDVIACGPGLGRGADVAVLVRGLLERATVPLVLDADALSVLAGQPELLNGTEDRNVIITPHPGEMARLLGISVDDVQNRRLDVAGEFAVNHGIYVVLKGYRSVVATPDGHLFINPSGNPGMATGGTGDVLTGALAAWLAQLLDAEMACILAVFLHGVAGDLAAVEHGQTSMVASDLLEQLGPALKQLADSEQSGVD
jgi:NAD(P)H-hydrate epimerase